MFPKKYLVKKAFAGNHCFLSGIPQSTCFWFLGELETVSLSLYIQAVFINLKSACPVSFDYLVIVLNKVS